MLPTNDGTLHSWPRKTPQVTSTYSRAGDEAEEHCDRSPDQQLKARDEIYRKNRRRQIATTRDEKFKMKVFWVVLAALIVGDYLYLPRLMPDVQLAWWEHTAIVVPLTFVCIVLIMKLRLLRPLRWLVTSVVLLALGLGALVWLDIIPHAL
jgi:hypothetical protein